MEVCYMMCSPLAIFGSLEENLDIVCPVDYIMCMVSPEPGPMVLQVF